MSRCVWWSNTDGKRCTLEAGHDGCHVNQFGVRFTREFREHGATEAELLLAHRAEFEVPIVEEVLGMQLLRDRHSMPELPARVRVSCKRLARAYLDRQLSMAWQHYMPQERAR